MDFIYDNRHRLTRETRTKTSVNPAVVEYDIEYSYDQLGNRTQRIDHVAQRKTVYSYDVHTPPSGMTYATRDNRLLSYQVFDTSSGSDVLLRTVTYTYYQSGWASNITIADAYVDPATTPGDPGDYDWRRDLALYCDPAQADRLWDAEGLGRRPAAVFGASIGRMGSPGGRLARPLPPSGGIRPRPDESTRPTLHGMNSREKGTSATDC